MGVSLVLCCDLCLLCCAVLESHGITVCTGMSETIFCMTCCLVVMTVTSLNGPQCMLSG